MICVHRLKGAEFWINHRLIETMEANPDTVLTLSSEHRYVIQESPEEVSKLIQNFESQIQVHERPIQKEKSQYLPKENSKDAASF